MMLSIFFMSVGHHKLSLKKFLFRSSAHFSIGLFVFLLLSCMCCFCILEIKPFSVALFAAFFSHALGCLFFVCLFFFAVQKLISLIRSHLFILFFCFLGPHAWYMEVPRLGVESELQLPAYARITATWIWAVSATYTTDHSNTRSLTHWVRPGIKLTSSWILVGFVNCWKEGNSWAFFFFFF